MSTNTQDPSTGSATDPTSIPSTVSSNDKLPILDRSVVAPWPKTDLESIKTILLGWTAEGSSKIFDSLPPSEKKRLVNSMHTMIDTTRRALATDPHRLELEKSLLDRTATTFHDNTESMKGLDRGIRQQFLKTFKPLTFLMQVSEIRRQMELEAEEEDDVSLERSVRAAAGNEEGKQMSLADAVALFGMLKNVPGALPDESECKLGLSGTRGTFMQSTEQMMEQVVRKARVTVMAEDAKHVQRVVERVRKLAMGE